MGFNSGFKGLNRQKKISAYVFENKVLRLNLDVTRTKKLKSKPLVMKHVIP